MIDSQRPDAFEPADYLRVLRRRWWIVLVLALLGAVLAGYYVKTAPKSYSSVASVEVNATAQSTSQVSGGRTSGAVDMDSEAQLVQSTTVASIADKLLHSTLPPSQLSRKVSVTVPANSDVLQISCQQPTGQAAATCAEDFATAYLQNRNTTASNQLNSSVTALKGQLSTLQQDASKLTGKISTLPVNSVQRANAQAQLRSENGQLSALSRSLAQLSASGASVSGGSIVSKAETPASPSSPQATLILPSGLIAGLVLGLIGAFFLDSRDKRIHSARDVERYLDLPVLLSLPKALAGPGPVGSRPGSGQAFAELAHGAAAAAGEGHHVLAVIGTTAGPSGSVVAANLAVALARTHSQVMLVCADLHLSVIPDLLGLGEGDGLAEVLAGTATVREVAQRPAEFPRLSVITPGTDPSLAVYNFQHHLINDMISGLRETTPFVIIELQSLPQGADTFALAEFADQAVIVAEVSKTRRPEIVETLRRLDRLRTTVLGAVVMPPARGQGRARTPKARQAGPGISAPAVTAEPRPRAVTPVPFVDDQTLAFNIDLSRLPTATSGGVSETWPTPPLRTVRAVRAVGDKGDNGDKNPEGTGEPEQPAGESSGT